LDDNKAAGADDSAGRARAGGGGGGGGVTRQAQFDSGGGVFVMYNSARLATLFSRFDQQVNKGFLVN